LSITPTRPININSKNPRYLIGKDSLTKNIFKLSLKETAYKIITEYISHNLRGHVQAVEKLEELFSSNIDYKSPSDPHFLFNQWLTDEKTLLYIACQEGKYDIVDFFLQKGLNTKIKSKSEDNEYETPLQAAARWNYVNIVHLLLDKGGYERKDIENCLKMKNLKPSVTSILKSHLKLIRRKSGCGCF
jgi:ankyrin repeat protein